MLNRRTFLAALASPIAGRLAGEVRTCSDGDVQQLGATMAAYVPPVPRDILPFSFPHFLSSARRPLWSELVAEGKADAYRNTLLAAYREMKKRPPDDPCSLTYQGWVHWFRCPMHGEREDVHENSGFLPWHRAYLYFYERLIQELGRQRHFRLLAWDWEKPGAQTVPGIYDSQDFFPAMGCQYVRTGTAIPVGDVVGYLQSNGKPPASHFFLGGANFRGGAEGGPHQMVHTQVGGLMGDLSVAAFDPVFFAHHGNIDRLWDFWYQRYKPVSGFFEGQTWPVSKDPWIFYDARIRRYVRVEPAQMVRVAPLGYHYTRPQLTLSD